MNKTAKRLVCYVIGLFIMTIGISFSVKSNLGVSPVSSIPYTITLVWGIEMGRATILFHIVLVLSQVLLLRKEFKIKNLLQIAVSFMFGYFTTFSNSLMSNLPDINNYFLRLVFLGISIVCVALGILLYLTPDIMPLAGEGVMGAVSYKFKKPFPKVKVGFDVTMVIVSLVTCVAAIHGLGSVREGTILSSVLVGSMLGVFTKLFKTKLVHFLEMNELDKDQEAA